MQNISHENDLIFKRTNVLVTSIFIQTRFATEAKSTIHPWAGSWSLWYMYLLNTRAICAIFLNNWTQCIDGFSLSLQRYVIKGSNERTQQFLASLCHRKNSVKCSAFAVARIIEIECFCRNFPFSNDPVVGISSGNLTKKKTEIGQKPRKWSSLNFAIGKF